MDLRFFIKSDCQTKQRIVSGGEDVSPVSTTLKISPGYFGQGFFVAKLPDGEFDLQKKWYR